ncbi:MAG: NADH-quinone oxidoreductase subunit F [Deltaproteobacteria bacterium]|nr:NADH-quinone oxidoreductase subunit F [Deltaproteobacteria bacterium]
MVEPVYLIVVALGAAFSLGLLRKAGFVMHHLVLLLSLATMTAISAQWTVGLFTGSVSPAAIPTAGFSPPISINLQMGKTEGFLTLLVNLSVFLSSLFMIKTVKRRSVYVPMLMLVFASGLNGIIMTRDLFNLFVFIEIMSIALAGLIVLNGDIQQLGAGFKYILAGALTSGLMLIGIIFTYHTTGSLNIDTIANALTPELKAVGYAGLFLIFIGVLIELKPFPVNGFGLDVYESAHPAVGAVVSAGAATATLYAFAKIAIMSGDLFLELSMVVGAVTFVGMNVVALQQKIANRLLGYSSLSQVGLLVLVWSLVKWQNIANGDLIVLGLLVTHAFAKATLFWLSGIIQKEKIEDWGIIKQRIYLLFPFAIALLALIGLPPFPSFFAKWELIMALAANQSHLAIALILGGSLVEAVYLMRWFGHAFKNTAAEDETLSVSFCQLLPVFAGGLLLIGLGYPASLLSATASPIPWMLTAFVLFTFAMEFLPAKIKNIIVMAAIAWYGYPLLTTIGGYRVIFAGIFVIGALVTMIPGFSHKGNRLGFYPSLTMMFAGLIGIIEAKETMSFFFYWEMMTVGSYFLILRGKNSKPHALSYFLFSLGGAYLILAAFGYSFGQTTSVSLDTLSQVASTPYAALVMLFLSIGFMTKTASVGLHIWLPGAHAEAESDVSPMVSGILLKAGIFGLLMTFIALGDQKIGFVDIAYVLSWVGAISALVGNYLAAMQEDAKRLLAYSSVGQMGYALFGLSLMSHLGWLGALSLSVIHFTYKVILFLAVGGIVYRLKTKNMYEMGGLIRKMPITFFAVLVSIIALSGIPPLAGFGGRWVAYNAVIEKGWMLQGAIIGFSGIIAFLYLFRLIHTIFLGQLKDAHRKVKEAPLPFLLPQMLLIGLVMFLSSRPHTFLAPIGEIVKEFKPDGALTWTGPLAQSHLGYWDGVMVMWVFMGLFAANFALLFIMNRRAQPVKQFNIVYAAERPARPETTHFAYNFFAPYRRALGFLEYPLATHFFDGITDFLHAAAGFIRRLYTGNGQTYLFQIVAFVVVVFLLANGGF